MNGIARHRVVEVFLQLVCSGLYERNMADLSAFPLTEGEWKSVMDMSVMQTVTGIVYRGICNLPDECMPSDRILMRWVVAVEKIEKHNRLMSRCIRSLMETFGSNGLFPVLQKGHGVAAYYEEPLVRECGDVDIYFHDRDSFRKAADIMKKLGCSVKAMPDSSVVYRWNGCIVEQHSRLIDIYNPFLRKYLSRLIKEKGFISADLGEGGKVTVPSPLINFLLLDVHILKHAIGRGIGLRQLCDMTRAAFCLHKEIDGAEFKSVSAKLGIEKWNALLFSFMCRYLGLEKEYLPYPVPETDAASLLEIVLSGGNFGLHRNDAVKPENMSVWKRKWNTVCAMTENMEFAFRYAPKEILGLIMELTAGQWKK